MVTSGFKMFQLATMALASSIGLGAPFENRFTFPAFLADKETFHYGDTVEFAWVTNFTKSELWLFCRAPDDDTIQTFWHQPARPGNASQLIHLDWSGMQYCWLNLRDEVINGINGPEWNFDNNRRESTTISVPTAAATIASTTADGPSTSSTRGTSAVTSVTSQQSTGFPSDWIHITHLLSPTASSVPPVIIPEENSSSDTARIGTIIGAVFGILSLALSIFTLRRRILAQRKKKQNEELCAMCHSKPELAGSCGGSAHGDREKGHPTARAHEMYDHNSTPQFEMDARPLKPSELSAEEAR